MKGSDKIIVAIPIKNIIYLYNINLLFSFEIKNIKQAIIESNSKYTGL